MAITLTVCLRTSLVCCLLVPARLLDTLDTAATVWTDVKSQAPTTQQNLVPLTKLWSEKTEEEIEVYQAVVKEQVCATPTLTLAKRYQHGDASVAKGVYLCPNDTYEFLV